METLFEMLKAYGLNAIFFILLLYYYFNKNSEKTYKKIWVLLAALAMFAALVVRVYISWVDIQPKPMAPYEEIEIIGPKDPSL